MHKEKPMRRITALLLAAVMTLGTTPMTAVAADDSIITSGEIIAFEVLPEETASQNKALGTPIEDLDLPETLTATVRTEASAEDTDQEESVQDSGESEPVEQGDTPDLATESSAQKITATTGSAISAEGTVEPVQSVPRGENAADGDGTDEDATELEVSVTWAAEPEYDGETMGTYLFILKLPKGLTLADGVESPTITVTVGTAAVTGTVTAFDELTDDTRWQNTTAPEFPKSISGTVAGEAAEIPVTWETEQDYDAEYPVRGLYVFTAILGEGYSLADDLELPRITIFIPETVRRTVGIMRMIGGGTNTSPLEITTAAQLDEIAELVNQGSLESFLFNNSNTTVYLKLQNDIDLSDYAGGEGWTPIGREGNPFKGSFDGGGNKITGLVISRESTSYQGLFGRIMNGGTVQNLGLENVAITGGQYTGGITGTVASGLIKNCYVSGNVTSASEYVGGIAGVTNNVTIENCYSSGSIEGGQYTGGIAGYVTGGTVKNCYSASGITSTGMYIGGIAGSVTGGTVKNCAALNPSISGGNVTGRVVGNKGYNGNLEGNTAFSGMTVNGSIVSGGTLLDKDGAGKSASEIRASGFWTTTSGFTEAWDTGIWQIAADKLPGFAAAVALPLHLTESSGSPFDGDGTSGNPYKISTPEQLAKLAGLVNGGNSFSDTYFQLENDLNLSAYAEVGGWTPIGNKDHPFTGNFNGNGKKITELTINRSSSAYQGLFGYVGNGGVVQKLGVENAKITGKKNVGGIAGGSTGTVQNCYVTGSIIATGDYAGGIAGSLPYSTDAGGKVDHCYSTAIVSAGDYAGGVAGLAEYSSTVKNCAALNPSVSGTSNAGRVAGYGLTGLSGNIAFSGMTVSGSIVSGGTLSDKNGAGKSAGEIRTSGFWTTTSGFTEAWDTSIWKKIEVEKLPGFAAAVALPLHLTESSTIPFDGEGSNSNPYKISTAEQLARLASLVNGGNDFSGKHFALQNDLDLSGYAGGEGWVPIGNDSYRFNGNFDGNGSKITGLTIGYSAALYKGLFGYVGIDGTVENLGVTDVSVTGNWYVGGVAGIVVGTVQNCYATGDVSGNYYVGGVAGHVYDTMQNCYATSSVSGNWYVGGVAGMVVGTVQNCYATGDVNGNSYVGGVAGIAENGGTVKNCYATGSIRGTSSYVGGVAGFVRSSLLQNCAALNPTVSGTHDVGRIVGYYDNSTLAKNYAYTGMDCISNGSNLYNGTGVTADTLFGASFWTTSDNWEDSAWDGNVWTFAEGKLPVLKGLAMQNSDGGLYLTTRDIQYAAVQTTGYTYTRETVYPTVTFDGKTLVKDTDYTVSITSADNSGTSAGTKAGTVTVTLSGKGNFTGTKTGVTYTIVKANGSLAISCANITYGETLSPQVTSQTGDGAVTYDYKVQGAVDDLYTANAPVNAGSYTVRSTLAETANYNEATATADFTISPKSDADFTIAAILNQTYTGCSFYPEPEVKVGSTVLIKNVDFTYSYSDNTNVGSDAKVSVLGIGNYAGSSGARFFNILKGTNLLVISCDNIPYGQTPAPNADVNISGGTMSYHYKVQGADDSTYTAVAPTAVGSYTVQGTSATTSNFNSKTATADFTISKASGTFTLTEAVSATYSPTLTLADITLPANYAWKDSSTAITAAGNGQIFAATYTDPSGNYEAANGNITVNVAKAAAPSITFPTAATAITYGQTLAAATLNSTSDANGSFAWAAPSTAPTVAQSGNAFAVTYTPTDTANYDYTNVTLTADVVVTVNKATAILTLEASPTGTQSRPGSATLTVALPANVTGTLTFKAGTDTIQAVALPNNTATFTPSNAANDYSFTVEYSGDSNYNSATSTVLAYSFTKSEQANINGVNSSMNYGETLDLSTLISGGSGTGSVSYAVTSGPGEISGTTLTPTGTGEVNITVIKAADDDYNAKNAAFQVTVNPRVITFTVDAVGTQVYTGNAVTPTPEVRDGTTVLTEGVHFNYSYEDNTNVGAFAAVNIIGTGSYAGSTGSATFTIVRMVPDITTPPAVSGTVYTGTALSQIALTGGEASVSGHFEWVNPTAAAVSGSNTFEVRFVPEDTLLYTEVSGINVTFNAVNRSSSGGDSSDSRNTTIIPTAQPNQPTIASVNATAQVTNGNAALIITDSMAKTAIEKALAAAKTNSNTANGISVDISVTASGATGFALTLERKALNRLLEADVKSFNISSLPVNMSFDTVALKQLQAQSGGNLAITVKPATVTGLRNAFDIMLSSTKDGKTINISSLGTGTSTLSILVEPGKNEFGGYLYGAYVGADKKINQIADSAYDANSRRMILSTDHFSVYGVGYTAPSAKFTDTAKHWAADSIDYVVGRGLLSGTTETTFAPDTAMSRGMLVTALGRLAGVDTKAYTTNSFTDVKTDSTFRPYIEWAYKKGVVQGIGNSQFAPDRAVTREEIAVIFANYAKATGYTLPVTRTAATFADASSIGSAYKTAVMSMQQAGIMMGEANNKFNPKANATRAEVSSMLHRYIKQTIDPATAQGWAKNDAGQYLYYKTGKAVTGTQTIDGVKYFFETTGVLKTGWVKDGNDWRFYSGNIMLVGFWNLGANGESETYYFTADGSMVFGKWLQIDRKWYYFYDDGKLAKSTKIDGYEVDENGVRKTK
ncbi:Peptidoglycan-binding lysin domain protein (modular protein) [uncultured Eubacteriales bacterium]|uniref:Peptidoglycan-binding lysin domain protein (Modular protein) n=2 Tax=uncultured Eubacteriales bacterium TaxID=172733 RepID=A0A212K7T3_9FIRM|nr:Peptidoglycan-binding lysin domain protein (modular protein) [uncultured Eubacteriales bacterium]